MTALSFQVAITPTVRRRAAGRRVGCRGRLLFRSLADPPGSGSCSDSPRREARVVDLTSELGFAQSTVPSIWPACATAAWWTIESTAVNRSTLDPPGTDGPVAGRRGRAGGDRVGGGALPHLRQRTESDDNVATVLTPQRRSALNRRSTAPGLRHRRLQPARRPSRDRRRRGGLLHRAGRRSGSTHSSRCPAPWW